MRSASTTEPSERRVIANVMKGSIGNLIEWYDWYTYAAFSVYFAATFFPKGNLTAQLLNTAKIAAVFSSWAAGCSGGSPTGTGAGARSPYPSR